jgi:hypothetical protein
MIVRWMVPLTAKPVTPGGSSWIKRSASGAQDGGNSRATQIGTLRLDAARLETGQFHESTMAG